MKKTIRIAVAALALIIALTTMAFVASGSNEPAVTVKSYNLSFKDSVYISYAVKFENVPDGAQTGVLIWDEAKSSYTKDTEGALRITEASDTVKIGGETCFVYDYKGISAKEMTKDIYMVAYINDGGEYTYSALSKYSVLQYVYNKLGYSGVGTPTTDEDFVGLLNSMLEYGAAAQSFFGENTDRLATAKYYMISLEGGTLADLSDGGLYLEGVELSVSADVPDGNTFEAWIDADGNVVSNSASFTYTVGTENVKLSVKYAE